MKEDGAIFTLGWINDFWVVGNAYLSGWSLQNFRSIKLLFDCKLGFKALEVPIILLSCGSTVISRDRQVHTC